MKESPMVGMKYKWPFNKTAGLILLIMLGAFMYSFVALDVKEYRVGDLGLGVATTTKVESWDGVTINEIEGGYKEILPGIAKARAQGKQVGLLFGNSQLHAINYQESTDHLTIYYLNQMAGEDSASVKFFQLSSPNINFQELLLYYLTLREMNNLPDWVVVGCPYRTFQLTGLRRDFETQLLNLSIKELGLKREVQSYYTEQANLLISLTGKEPEQGTRQEIVESRITDFIEKHWEAYRYRGNVRSRIKVLPGIVYRSTVSVKNLYEGSETTEKLNMLFLEQLVELCKKDGVKVLLYQPPHPQSEEPFQYNRSRYEAAFKKIQAMEDPAHHVYFKSFETVVPVEYWGKSNSGRLDAFHFKNEGHQLLSKNIFDFLKTHTAE